MAASAGGLHGPASAVPEEETRSAVRAPTRGGGRKAGGKDGEAAGAGAKMNGEEGGGRRACGDGASGYRPPARRLRGALAFALGRAALGWLSLRARPRAESPRTAAAAGSAGSPHNLPPRARSGLAGLPRCAQTWELVHPSLGSWLPEPTSADLCLDLGVCAKGVFVGGKPTMRNWLRTSCGCMIFLLLDLSKSSPTTNGIPSSDTTNEAMDPFHACSILKQLKTMYDEGQLTDIVVEVDHGKTFSCHRNVLAAISPYFRYDDGRNLYCYPIRTRLPFIASIAHLVLILSWEQTNKGKPCVCFLGASNRPWLINEPLFWTVGILSSESWVLSWWTSVWGAPQYGRRRHMWTLWCLKIKIFSNSAALIRVKCTGTCGWWLLYWAA